MDEEKFREALDDLIIRAYENDLDIDNGGHILRHDSEDIPDVEVVVYQLIDSSVL